MLRKIAALLLIFSLLAFNLSRFFAYAGFKVNEKFIAAKLCENRNKPMLHCKGKCYLKKKLKQAEEKEKSQETQSQKGQYEVLTVSKLKTPILYPITLDRIFADLHFAITQQSTEIFQPPRA